MNSNSNPKSHTKVMTLEEIIGDTSQPPPAIVGNGILLENTLLLICGKEKAKKSFLAMNIAIAVSSGIGNNWLKITRPYTVLYLSAEGGYYPNRDRIKKMVEHHPVTDHEKLRVHFDARFQIDDPEGFASLKELVHEVKPEVLIIDPLVCFHGVEENSASEMSRIMQMLRELIEDNNLSIILVHHNGKDQSQGARGSSAIHGAYDSFIQINKSNGNQRISFDMRHVQKPEDITIRFNTNTFWFERVQQFEPIVALLQKRGCLDKNQLAKACVEEELYKSAKSAYNAIKKAADKKQIFEVDGKFCVGD